MKSTVYSPQPTAGKAGRMATGFTLIEVLVAMTVLSVMVLMVANIFQSSSASWNIGTQKADMNTSARAALDYMARELQFAVAGPIDKIVAGANSEIMFELQNGNDVRFVSLAGEPEGSNRALMASLFRFFNNTIQYKRETSAFNPYTQSLPTWVGAPHMLIANVLSLNMYAYANEFDLNGGVGADNYNANSLPLCLDIAVEMLSDDDMQRYNQLTVLADKTAFKDRNAKVYSTRVYFPNRVGYGGH